MRIKWIDMVHQNKQSNLIPNLLRKIGTLEMAFKAHIWRKRFNTVNQKHKVIGQIKKIFNKLQIEP